MQISANPLVTCRSRKNADSRTGRRGERGMTERKSGLATCAVHVEDLSQSKRQTMLAVLYPDKMQLLGKKASLFYGNIFIDPESAPNLN